MKAYKDSHGKIRLFRPDLNMIRLDNSMRRMAMPALDKDNFVKCIEELIKLDASWVPSDLGYSLYIRPLAIGTSVCFIFIIFVTLFKLLLIFVFVFFF